MLSKKPFLVLTALLGVMLALMACGRGAQPTAVAVRPSATAPVAQTATPAPTWTPTPPLPTATWVPLITPSPTPGERLPSRADVPRVGPAEAKAAVEAGLAVLVDVRSAAAYEQAHIDGALSIPADQVARHAGGLPAGKLPIFYCA